MIYGVISIFSLIFCYILKSLNVDNTVVSVAFISIFSFILITKILRINTDKYCKVILIIALLLRILLIFTDVYMFRLPDAGKDDDGFYNTAITFYESEEPFDLKCYGSYFTLIIYILFKIIGTARIGVQFFNVFISICGLIVLNKSMQLINVNKKTERIIMLLLCFMPYIMFSNSILRRDTLITFFVILAINELIKWIEDKKMIYCIKSCCFITCGALFHIAVIFSLAIFLIFFTLYKHKSKKLILRGNGKLKLIIIILIIAAFGTLFLSNFNSKFSNIDSIEDIYNNVNRSKGSSAYLTDVKIDTIPKLILWSPIKFIYFLVSPMPWKFRNIMDIASFLMDSSIYLFYFVGVLKSNKKVSESKCLLISFLLVGLVFSLGTFNSGTAIRHRYNILPFIVIAYAIQNKKIISN